MYTLQYGDKRAHFLAMPRTASKACRNALRALGAQTVGGHHNIDLFDTVVEPNDLVMSTVRNHWDWFVSFWYLNGCPGKFDRFVPKLCRESEWINRNPTCTDCRLFWKYVPLSTVILRFERLEHDLNDAMQTHGFPILDLQQDGPKKPRPYQIYYKQGTREYVRSRFKNEIAKFGYKF